MSDKFNTEQQKADRKAAIAMAIETLAARYNDDQPFVLLAFGPDGRHVSAHSSDHADHFRVLGALDVAKDTFLKFGFNTDAKTPAEQRMSARVDEARDLALQAKSLFETMKREGDKRGLFGRKRK